jgi:hypothetical protein
VSALTLVILAAGMGARYGGLKQAEPVGPNGELIIHYSLYDALQAGFTKVVFLIRHDIEEAFRERVGRTFERQVDVCYAFQQLEDLPRGFAVPPGRKKPWGTGHALLCCKEIVQGNFGAINADDFYGATSFKLLVESLRTAVDTEYVYDYANIGYLLGNTLSEHGHVSRGVCEVGPTGLLQSVRECLHVEKLSSGICYVDANGTVQPLASDSVVSMNMWGFTRSLFDELERRFPEFLERAMSNDPLQSEFLLPRVVSEMVQDGKARVRVLMTNEKWFGITYQADRASAQSAIRRLIASEKYPADLWHG